MASLGKTITLYLMDGTASKRWQATLSNWNGKAFKIPRMELKNCQDIPELSNPGVYFLFGKDDGESKPFIYVGEADDVLKRLLQPHTFEAKGNSYWTEAVIFVTPDGTLEKGRVKYLENRFYSIAVDAKRYLVKNGNTPTQSPMPKQIQDLLEEFILNAQLILPALGYDALEPLPSSQAASPEDTNNHLYFSRNGGKGGKGEGRIASDGFWVLKGSYIYPEVASYTSPGIKKARHDCAGIIDQNGILQEDICFGSPSFASTFICGKNSNGLVEWKNANDISLKNLNSSLPVSKKQEANQEGQEESENETEDTNGLLSLSYRGLKATGKLVDKGFIVLKGSSFSSTETKSCQPYLKELRKELEKAKKVSDGKFSEDVPFDSPSSAAGCIVGGSINGKIAWTYPDGKTIKDKETAGKTTDPK